MEDVHFKHRRYLISDFTDSLLLGGFVRTRARAREPIFCQITRIRFTAFAVKASGGLNVS